MSFASNIRNCRKEKGWSQKEASEQLDIKYHNLGAYEEGRAFPPPDALVKFIITYDIPECQVFNFLFSKDYSLLKTSA